MVSLHENYSLVFGTQELLRTEQNGSRKFKTNPILLSFLERQIKFNSTKNGLTKPFHKSDSTSEDFEAENVQEEKYFIPSRYMGQ